MERRIGINPKQRPQRTILNLALRSMSILSLETDLRDGQRILPLLRTLPNQDKNSDPIELLREISKVISYLLGCKRIRRLARLIRGYYFTASNALWGLTLRA